MNHGDMAYISQDDLRLSNDLLRPLSIVKGADLTCFFSALDDQSHPDLFLSPIPYRSWPYVAGMRIDLPQKQGAIADLTRLLKENDVNILMAQCAREGYHTGTCNFVLEFESLLPDEKGDEADLTLSQIDRIAQKHLPNEIEKLENTLDRSNLLRPEVLSGYPDCYRRNPLRIWPIRRLSHFYRSCRENGYETFKAFCKDEGLLSLENALYVKDWEAFREELPTLGFASMDTDTFGLSVTVFRQSGLPHFRQVRIDYSQVRAGKKARSSKGLIHSIAQELRDDWDLWKVYDLTKRNTPSREEGAVKIIMERIERHPRNKDLDQEVQEVLRQASPKELGIQYENVEVHPVSHRRLFVSLQSSAKFERRRDVLRLCRELAPTIGVLPDNIVTVESYTATSVTSEVTETIKGCSGMLQFYLGDAEHMDWLNAEFFLACYLEIPTVRFVDPALEGKLLFQRDRPAKQLPENASDGIFRETIMDALRELDGKMRGTRIDQ